MQQKTPNVMYKIASLLLVLAILSIGLLVSAHANTQTTTLNLQFLSQTPDPVEPGSYVDLRWRVVNLGGGTEEFTFEILPDYPFSVEGDTRITRQISGFQSGTGSDVLFFRVRIADDAVEGDLNKIRLAYSKTGSTGIDRTILEQPVRIQSREGLIEISQVRLQPEKITIGSEFTASLVVRNLGPSAINNVKVSLDTANTGFTPIGSSNQKIVSVVPGNGATEVPFRFFADGNTEVKVHAIPVEIAYVDSVGRQNTLRTTVGFQIDATPSFLYNLEQTNIVTPNSRGRIVLSISNIGKSELNFGVLELLESEDYEILSSQKMYLGNLNSDDFETGQYDIFLKGSGESAVPLKFKVYYRDAYDKMYEEEFVVMHRLFTSAQAKQYGFSNGGGGSGLGIIVLIVIVGGVWWFVRSRKKAKAKRLQSQK